MKATTLSPLTGREKLELRIGGLEDQAKRLAADITEDEMTLAVLHAGTGDRPACGFATEDECAAFITSSRDKLTADMATLDGLYAELALLLQAEAPTLAAVPAPMTAEQAQEIREGAADTAKRLARMSAAELRRIVTAELAARNITHLFGQSSKDELFWEVMRLRGYSSERQNEATHVLGHDVAYQHCQYCTAVTAGSAA